MSIYHHDHRNFSYTSGNSIIDCVIRATINFKICGVCSGKSLGGVPGDFCSLVWSTVSGGAGSKLTATRGKDVRLQRIDNAKIFFLFPVFGLEITFFCVSGEFAESRRMPHSFEAGSCNLRQDLFFTLSYIFYVNYSLSKWQNFTATLGNCCSR